MKQLSKGEFFGETNRTIHLDGLTLTDTVYTHDKVDWHYHEQAYFTFILEGGVIEANKNETYECAPGTLLFHNWQEAHYNIKPPGFTRGFHVEIDSDWFVRSGLKGSRQGSFRIDNPSAILSMYRIAAETKSLSPGSALAIESLLIDLLDGMQQSPQRITYKKPAWVSPLQELLHAKFDGNLSLSELSVFVGIHPVHLSRDFPKYFHCTLGEYIRKLKIARSMVLLADKEQSLTAIAYECGFADHSHFTRSFRAAHGMTPNVYRRLMFG